MLEPTYVCGPGEVGRVHSTPCFIVLHIFCSWSKENSNEYSGPLPWRRTIHKFSRQDTRPRDRGHREGRAAWEEEGVVAVRKPDLDQYGGCPTLSRKSTEGVKSLAVCCKSTPTPPPLTPPPHLSCLHHVSGSHLVSACHMPEATSGFFSPSRQF